MLSRFSCIRLLVTLWTVVRQAPLSMGFSRQEYWSGLPFPSPGDLPDPGLEPTSPVSPALAGGFFTTSSTWEAWAVHQNLMQQCKSTILQDKIKWQKKQVWMSLVCIKPLSVLPPKDLELELLMDSLFQTPFLFLTIFFSFCPLTLPCQNRNPQISYPSRMPCPSPGKF